MSYANGRYWITYNGESYNYMELCKELTDRARRFVSGSILMTIPVPIIQEIPLALLLRATSVAGCCRSVIARFQWK